MILKIQIIIEIESVEAIFPSKQKIIWLKEMKWKIKDIKLSIKIWFDMKVN